MLRPLLDDGEPDPEEMEVMRRERRKLCRNLLSGSRAETPVFQLTGFARL